MKQMVEFLKNCPALSGHIIREDLLAPAAGSISVVPDGGEQTLKLYTSGDMLGQYNFIILLRENFTGEAGVLSYKLSDWISSEKYELPVLDKNKIAQYVEVAEGPELIKTEVGAGVFQMKLRLVYYRKGVII